MTTLLHILIVDDDPIFSAVAESLIASVGLHRVVLASDGEKGLRALEGADRDIDLILLDLNMPNLDGLAFLRKLAERGFAGRVILSSGESQAIRGAADHMGRMLGVDVCGALTKPLRVEAFLAEFEKCLNTKAQPAKSNAQKLRTGQAAKDGSLVPYYQPQIEIVGESVVGLEALIRLETVDGRILGPNAVFHSDFPPESLADLSLAIAKAVMDDVAKWQASGIIRRVSINLDARVIEDRHMLPRLIEMAKERRIEPASLVFELTETALPNSMTDLIETLTRLRMAGFGLSIDDYGTGAANFSMLRLCPFSELKIDRSIIVPAAGGDLVSRLFVENLAAIAVDLDMEVVAEGVETREQLAFVRDIGIKVVQGFLYSPAVPSELAFPRSNYRTAEMKRAAG